MSCSYITHLVAIAVRYFRTKRTISDNFPLADTRKSPAMVLRILVFNLYTLITLRYARGALSAEQVFIDYMKYSAGIVFLSHVTWAWPYVIQAGRKCSFTKLAIILSLTLKDCCSAPVCISCLRNTKGK